MNLYNRIRYTISAWRNYKGAYRAISDGLYRKYYALQRQLTGSPDSEAEPVCCANPRPTVISVIVEGLLTAGLSDHLRATLSIYRMCKKRGLPYRIYWAFPFNLEDYLVPAKYDWRISYESLRWDGSTQWLEVQRFTPPYFNH